MAAVPELPILESRIDWITATAPHDESGTVLLTLAEVFVESEQEAGNKLSPWRFQGYDGFQCGHWRYGWGRQGAIVVASGEQAHKTAPILAHRAKHWSRLDYAVTVHDPAQTFDAVEAGCQQWKWRDKPIRGTASLTSIRELGGGASLIIGQRASEKYTRIYDKFHESRGDYPKGTWRYEIEYKRAASEAEQRTWRDGGLDAAAIASRLNGELIRYGIEVPWRSGQERLILTGHRTPSDASLKAEWLKRCIRPTVQFVAEALGRDAVVEALGLPIHYVKKGEI